MRNLTCPEPFNISLVDYAGFRFTSEIVYPVPSHVPRETVAHSNNFLAYQASFSAIFTSAHKSYLTCPYPTRGIDKKRIITPVGNKLVV